jgi:PAS domain S-box-containing protein
MNTELYQRQIVVLHLEDSEDDHLLVADALADDELNYKLTLVKSKDEYTRALHAAKYDLIISDYSLPSYDGASALSLARTTQPETPFIFFSGAIGEEMAVDSLKAGATDYVLKQRPARLIAAIHQALRRVAESARLHRAEAIIREQGALLDKAQDAIIVCNLGQSIIYWNQGAERVYGWSPAEALGKNIRELLFHDNLPVEAQAAEKHIEERGEWIGELPEFTKDGRTILVQSRVTLVRDERDHPKSLLIINTDITEKKNYEIQLLRAQRMESLGTLAGGIAHDLNNALQPIIIGAQLLKDEETDAERIKLADMICTSANRGAAMVRQILSFARGSKSQTRQISVRQLVDEMVKVIRDTFPKSILISSRTRDDLWNVSGDTTELHQVILNLCVNARDAMPVGGTLTLHAENQLLNAGAKNLPPDMSPGSYVLLAVADTGTGIPPEVMARIFEPFFSTKAPDRGTGLGLSTVASIVKHHNGFIQVESEVDRGTRFKVYLPASPDVALEKMTPEVVLPVGHGELVLVMDDEASVRQMTKSTLENYGYRVVTAISGLNGIVTFQERRHEIKLLVSDTDMPIMGGLAAINIIQKLDSKIPIIIASGSNPDPDKFKNQIDTSHLTTLEKPYTVEQLLLAVARALN